MQWWKYDYRNKMKTLSLSERHNYILETLRQQGSVSVVDLANQLKVSSVTIRKDLTLLEEKEMLYRTHGLWRQASGRAPAWSAGPTAR